MGIAVSVQKSAKSACFLCDKTSETVIWREDGIEGLLCDCGMVYTNQFTYLARPELSQEYHPQHFYALPAAFKAAWVARHCPRGRLLDVGCGAGFFLSAVRERGYEVVGLEPSPAYDQDLAKRDIPVVHEYVEETSLPRHSLTLSIIATCWRIFQIQFDRCRQCANCWARAAFYVSKLDSSVEFCPPGIHWLVGSGWGSTSGFIPIWLLNA